MKELAAKLVSEFKTKHGRVKVDIGCGAYPRGEDFITVDKYAGETVNGIELKADLKADMWELPLDDGVVDEIWCSHSLEHLPAAKVPLALNEFARILRKGGRAVITVPNFDYIAKYWLLGQDRRWAEALVMGLQNTDGEYHKSCFNSELLRGDLEGCGFEVKVLKLVWTHNQECLQAVAIRK